MRAFAEAVGKCRSKKRLVIIKVGGSKPPSNTILNVLRGREARLITLTGNKGDAEFAREQAKKYGNLLCCVALAQPENFFHIWEQNCHILYVDESEWLDSLPAKSTRVDYLVCHKDDPLSQVLQSEGWDRLVDEDYQLWQNTVRVPV